MIEDIKIKLPGRNLAALRTVNGTPHCRILCAHGWLDNANSFLPLLPMIKDAELVAIDLPGHGYSDHQQSIYTLATETHTLLAIADALGWTDFSLIGHSLGGCIAPFSAAVAPERIRKLILIEAAGPISEEAQQLPERLKKFHHDMSQRDKYESRVFNSIDQAVASRLRANKMMPESARLIVERQLQETTVEGQTQWRWRFDHKLRITSPSYFTEDQVREILKSISCATLCIIADQGYLVNRHETDARLQCISDIKSVTLTGFHHLHLDTPEPVADEINQFLV